MPDFFIKFFFSCCKIRSCKAVTLIELLLVVAILGTLSAIAVPAYTGYIDSANNTKALADIRNIESLIERFRVLNGTPPTTLALAGIAAPNDPWGRPYSYLRIQGVDPQTIKHLTRWDKHDKPLNTDYDLYSIGKDGITDVKLFKPAAYDDIIRCHDGAYVGPVSEF